MGKVLDFRSYHMINEEDGTNKPKKSTQAAIQILNMFFSAYTNLVTKIGDYKDAQTDLLKVAEADGKDMGKVMEEVLKKISSKVDPKYSEAAKSISDAGVKINAVYSRVMETEDVINSEKEIKNEIYKKIINYIKSLKTEIGEAPKVGKDKDAKNESLNSIEQGHLFLFEKNTFPGERENLIKTITPIIAHLDTLSKNAPSSDLRTKAADIKKQLEDIQLKLSNDEEWGNLKRKNRISGLEEINQTIEEIKNNFYNELINTVSKIGLDNEIVEKIKEINKIISNAIKSLHKKEATIIVGDLEKISKEEFEKDKKDKEEDEDKDETYEDIKSGKSDISNLKKKGKNREKIRKAQEKINLLLPEEEKKIAEDGLYGTNTEIAIKKIADKFKDIAPELLKDIDGKLLTSGFQKFLNKYNENKEKIKELFKQ